MGRITACRARRLIACISFLFSLVFTCQANAILIQALPNISDVAVGDAFRVDIEISGLEHQSPSEIVRGYHLDVVYTQDITAATDVIFGDMLGLSSPLSSFLQKSAFSNGNVMLEEVSLWDDSVLDLAQPDSFVLASIGFVALNEGTVNYDFTPYIDFGIDIKGLNAQILPVAVMSSSVNIHRLTIPAPATILLFGVGLLGMVIRKPERMKLP